MANFREIGLSLIAELYGRTIRPGVTPGLDLTKARKVLVVRTDEIGDMAMFTPALRELRRNLPAAHISLLVREDVANLIELCPYVDEVLRLPHIAVRGKFRYAVPKLVAYSRRELVPREFDVAINSRWDIDYHRSALTTLVSKAEVRIGYSDNLADLKKRIGPIADQVFTHAFSDLALMHGVDKNLRLLELLGLEVLDRRQELWWDKADEEAVDEVFAVSGARPVLGLGIGCSEAKRCWPVESFVEVANGFIERHDGYVWIAGGAHDRVAGARLLEHLPGRVLNAACSLTLRQSAAAMKRCAAFVGNNSGPAHLAATANIPVVQITCHPVGGDPNHYLAPERFHPYCSRYRVLRPEAIEPCERSCEADSMHCIGNVSPKEVEAALEELLA